MASYGLIAGLDWREMHRLTPGLICDLYVLRQRYDDQQHGIRRVKESACAD